MPEETETLTPDQLLEILSQTDRSSPFFTHAAKVLDSRLAPEGFPVETAAERKPLTIGMATYDDYDGVYFSVQAIRYYHPEVTERSEILIVDNHPGGPASEALRKLAEHVAHCRYIPVTCINGTSVREAVFREAAGDFVLCMDSHVLLAPGSLHVLLDYCEAHPDTNDLLQGPLISDNLTDPSTHFDPVWSEGMWGVWARDARGADADLPPFEIPMQGLGVFACRREAWLGFNPRLRGFGGEEGTLHEKFRQAGGVTLCLPFLRWLHRFDRPRGLAYPVSWEDRIRNYLILFEELGLDPAPVVEHFQKLLGSENADRIVETVRLELAGPFHFFDAIYCINLDSGQAVAKQFQALGIAERVRRCAVIDTPSNHHIGCALLHRAIIAEAKKYRLRNVLVFEDDVMFAGDALGRSVAELRGQEWGVRYLGESVVAYDESIYDRILADVPDTPTGVALWLRSEHPGAIEIGVPRGAKKPPERRLQPGLAAPQNGTIAV